MRERMGPVDGAWFRSDRPRNTADVVSLLTFQRLPPADRIRQLVQERLLACPRFRQRALPGTALARDDWEDDPTFRLEDHLVQVRLDGDGQAALRSFVSRVATEPLDPGRPLWRAYLVEAPGCAAIVTKIHHCLADGFALVALLLSLADEGDLEPPSKHALAAFRRLEPWLDPRALLRAAARNPARALAVGVEAAAIGAALGRYVLLPQDRHPALKPELSGRRRVAWSRGLSLQRVRDAGRLHGATINDVLLAAVAGALRSHLVVAGERVDDHGVRALVPVNLRPGLPDTTRGPLGNRFGLVFLDLPTDLPSAHARLVAVRRRAQIVKSRPDAVMSFGVLAAIGAVPALVQPAGDFFSGKASVVVTNVPGPRRHLHLAGERVENAMFWVPNAMTLGLGISVLTYAGEVRIGVRADEAVLREPADLVEHFERELVRLGAHVDDDADASFDSASLRSGGARAAGATPSAAAGTRSP